MSNYAIKRAIKAGWDEMSPSYQQDAVISTEDVHYGPLIPGEKDYQLLGNVAGKQVLELGCGAAQNSVALSKWGAHATAVDLSPVQLAHAREMIDSERADVDLVQGDIEGLAMFIDESFDIVLSSNVIEFVLDLSACLRECYRVLGPDGLLVIATVHPLAAFDWDEAGSALLVDNYFNLPVEVWDELTGSDGQKGLTFYRTFEQMFTTLTSVGFVVEQVLEPVPYPIHRMNESEKWTIPYRGESWERQYERMSRVPFNIIFVSRRPG